MVNMSGSGGPARRRGASRFRLGLLLAPAWVVTACIFPVQVAPLGRDPVLETLGIPALDKVTLTPVFTSGFERDTDFSGFYVTPQSALTHHGVRSGGAHSGDRAHVGWLTGVTGTEPVDGPNHRGYPTIQLQKGRSRRAPRRAWSSSGRGSTMCRCSEVSGSAWPPSRPTRPTDGHGW